MTSHRFLQIHTLSPYMGALLNRDESGLAKRIPYGGELRTRISSQCLKRHWRIADDPHALERIDEDKISFRSRELVTHCVIDPLRVRFCGDVVNALEREFQIVIYGEKGTSKKSRQTLLFGKPELDWLAEQAVYLAEEADGDAKLAEEAAKDWGKNYSRNIKALRENTALPAGLTAALFGRMVTSDTNANIAAPIHVAHAFTVHAEEVENDYFTAVDDLAEGEPGADTIQETELTSGLFYGYVVVDLHGLTNNVGRDEKLAGQVLFDLVHLIAEVSPGAKLGSTAPYSRASLMLLEAGERQPRSLAEAFRSPCKPETLAAVSVLVDHLKLLDEAYDTGEERHVMTIVNMEIPGARQGSLTNLAEWARTLPGEVV